MTCLHPITIDVHRKVGRDGQSGWWRECALCGLSYARGLLLAALASRCWARWSVDFGRVSRAIRDEGEWRGEEFAP